MRLLLCLLPALVGCVPGMRLETAERQLPLSGRRSSAGLVYRLREPLRINEEQAAFFLRYRGLPAGAELRLLSDGETEAIRLPDMAAADQRPTELHVPLPASMRLDGFEIVADERIEAPLAAGIALLFNGYSEGSSTGDAVRDTANQPTIVRAGIELRPTAAGGQEYRLAAATAGGDPQRLFVRIEYEPVPDSAPDSASDAESGPAPDPVPNAAASAETVGRIRLGGAGRERSFELRLRPRPVSVYLYASWLGFVPDWLRIEPPDGEQLHIRAVEVGSLTDSEQQSLTPIVADMGLILTQRPEQLWRRADWELFAWNLFPEILVLDSRSYAVQARFFKRLAFHAEKRGYRGRLLDIAELSGLFGWNAHNYDAERLARFFNQVEQQAARQEIELTAEEQLLLRLLLENGIIGRRGGGYVALRGGILAISQESPALLREFLLTHESFHGLYAASTEYRRAAMQVWRGLDGAERAFWRRLFGSLTYDPDDGQLVADEFQAYLMHYGGAQAIGYWQLMIERLNRRLPQQRRATLQLLANYPALFARPAAALDRAARLHSGVEAGDVRCLVE